MFNFHKPRTYRSVDGCCICRAKSSSSRFTDSRKYERDTMQCFDLKYPRQGEICNACVLLVKRFKRLPVGSKRNWSHVVDARAGPGSSKIQTKYKSERTSSRTHQSSNTTTTASPPSACLSNSNNGGSPNSAANGHAMSFLPEKFSKIFKKSKKVKETSSSSSSSSSTSASKRKTSSHGWSSSHNGGGLHSLPTTPDSLDSDYEDSRLHGTMPGSLGGTVVQFQTQTRASAFKAQAAMEARRRSLKLGSKRRKCLKPRKNRRTVTYEETLNFYDEEEWREQKSCCGMLHECPALGGAIILDVDNYKPCEKHQIPSISETTTSQASLSLNANESTECIASATEAAVKPLSHSIPTVVQLQPPNIALTVASAAFSSCSSISLGTTTVTPLAASSSSALTITKSTPVLKKHHLFFKRQSECFPQGDIVNTQSGGETSNATNNYYNSNNINTIMKTESDYSNHTQQQQQQQQHQYSSHPQSTTIFQRHNEHNVTHSAASSAAASSSLSISVTSVSASMPSASLFTSTMPQMPKHSLAKVTTISPPINTSMPPYQSLKPHSSFLHKIKADTGKIVKHSLEKFNTAVRLKSSDLNDMKPIIKTVDKSYILAKPPTTANIQSLNAVAAATATTTYQSLASYNSMAQPPLTTTSLSAASPTSSTSSTSSTKFSDNSSDSGFDENMLLDRKSASPLQEDCEKKLLSRQGVQTMFLASGVQIQGQPQNLVLTGNEVAAKILQNRKYSSVPTSATVASNARVLPTNHPTTTAVKIAQISTGNGSNIGGAPPTSSSSSSCSSLMSSAAQAKMRAIYNNSNTIQHENGITTIVPASSLAASSQMAAMQNIAPSSVTITPAPTSVVGGGNGNTHFSAQNIISRKLTAANIINLQSNNLSNATHTHLNSINNNNISGNHLNSATIANQKIILLKTSPHNNQTLSSSLSMSSPITAAKYSTTTGGAVGGR